MKNRKLKFQFGPSAKTGQFHWRIRAKNGEIIAQGEGYPRVRSAKRVFSLLSNAFANDEIELVELDAKGRPKPAPKYIGTLVSAEPRRR